MARGSTPPVPWDCPDCGQIHPRGCHGHAKHTSDDRAHLRNPDGRTPCRNPPVRGLHVCNSHGVNQRAKAAVERRIEAEEAERIISIYAALDPDVDYAETVLNLVIYGTARVKYYREREERLTDQQMIWGRTKEATGGKDKGETFEAKAHAWIALRREAERDLASDCFNALKVGIKQMEIDLAAKMADKIMPILDAMFAEFDLDPADPRTAERIDRVLRLAA